MEHSNLVNKLGNKQQLVILCQLHFVSIVVLLSCLAERSASASTFLSPAVTAVTRIMMCVRACVRA